MYCPECGNDAGNAKFCPECGVKLDAVREAIGGPAPARTGVPAGPARTTGGPGKAKRSEARRPAQAGKAAGPASTANPIKPAMLWGIVAVIAIVVIAVVLVAQGNSSSGKPTGGSSLPPVAVTQGDYVTLKGTADALYDEGAKALQSGTGDGAFSQEAAQYFAAAAKTYAAAWKKDSSDPNLATDWSYALFQSGQTTAAIAKADEVIKRWPDFQAAFHHRGLFLMMEAFRLGDSAQGKKMLAAAKAALQKAIDLGPSTDFGKEAATFLQQAKAAPGGSGSPSP